MECLKEEAEEESSVGVLLELEIPVGETFDLEKAICSHGFFMMSPNQWDALSRTFSRPLRLSSRSSSSSVSVSVSHPLDLPHSLRLRVHSTRSLAPWDQEYIVGQVVRMLRLSEKEERNAREFQEMVMAMAADGDAGMGSFGGRVFRSPTLFEDMVKCVLLCNCQWSRSLSMANALCELQPELHSLCPEIVTPNFIPNTPPMKDHKRKTTNVLENGTHLAMDKYWSSAGFFSDDSCGKCKSAQSQPSDLYLLNDKGDTFEPSVFLQPAAPKRICNFPTPEELAYLDETFLAKRCNLGYRASRIIKLARGIVEGRIPLRELEEACDGESLSSYDKLADQLRQIEGFGHFTCANVLMCMGFYHVIPTDSETVRHLKQAHAKNSTIQTVQRDVEEIYGKYAPFQFLAYWAELWHFYEKIFGKLSEMPFSDYKLITASNMRSKGSHKSKRTKYPDPEFPCLELNKKVSDILCPRYVLPIEIVLYACWPTDLHI